MPLITRRQFVARTTALLGSTATLRLRSQAISPNETIGAAIVGVRGRGRTFVQDLPRRDNVALVALCDVDQNVLRETAPAIKNEAGKAPYVASDFRRLLDDKSIQAIFIATPHHWHSPIALSALQAGKDVYVEKPASHVFREGRLLVEAAKKHRRIVQHGTQMRSSEVLERAGEVLASGILGEVKMAKAWNVQRHSHRQPVSDAPAPDYVDYDAWLGPAQKRPFNPNRFHGNWQWYRDYGNGDIGNDGAHDLDMARWGLGATAHPVKITAHGSRVDLTGEREYPDNMVVAYEYADKKVLLYEDRGWTPYGLHGFDSGNAFYGTKGYMLFSRRGYFQVFLGQNEEKGPGMRGGAGMPNHVSNFLECMRTRKEPSASAEVAHFSCGLIHLGEIAYRLGRVLHFDPTAETFPGDPEASALLTKEYRAPWGLPEPV
jgi:predicted dehydrogenase